MFSAIADGFNYLFGFLGQFGTWLLSGLQKLLQPVFDLLAAIFYFIYDLGLLLLKVLSLVIGLARLLIGLMTGFFKTITGFGYSGQGQLLPASYTDAFGHLQPIFAMLQLDKVAYIFLFSIWLYTAWAAMQKISRMR